MLKLMTLKPVFNRVIVVECSAPAPTSKGVIIPDVAADVLGVGVIAGVSEGVELRAGDKVLYRRAEAVAYRAGETEVVILDADAVLAVVCDE